LYNYIINCLHLFCFLELSPYNILYDPTIPFHITYYKMGFIVWSIAIMMMILLYVIYMSVSLYQEKNSTYGQGPSGPTELFGNRDRPIDNATGQALPIHNNETDQDAKNVKNGNRFPGQQVTAPEIIAPATHQGILADYSISVDKPYDDFVSPEPHHLEQIHPKTLNAACNQFNGNKTTCQSSRLCVYVDDGIAGDVGTCVAAFSNTTNARANNNYMSKTMPQGDLFYYYKDGVCYGDCEGGWRPQYAHPDPIVVANLKNDNTTGVSFAGKLTPAEMYNRKSMPLPLDSTVSTTQNPRRIPPTLGTILPNNNNLIQPLHVLPVVDNVIGGAIDAGQHLVSDVITVAAEAVVAATDMCQPKCSTGYVCERNMCVAKGPRYGDNRACNLSCGQNYQCQLNVLDQPVCMPILSSLF
jgi:hypothetical protein